jgi:hypothetical protein
MNRQEAVDAIVRGGKTPEQAEAFLAILGSAWRRRDWLPGEPLSGEEIRTNLDTFLGGETGPPADPLSR